MLNPKLKETAWNKNLEENVRKIWIKQKTYRFNLASRKPIFSIDTPPPYPSGRPWHIGAAAHYSQIDMIARTARMFGREVLFPICIDRNGLPVELYTEKKYKIHIQDVSREKFISFCITALDDLEAEMISIMKSMGMSGDFDDYYRTDSKEYRALTQATFIELWKRGLIYEDMRPNNYCTGCRTTIADAEVIYEERKTELVHVKFNLKKGGDIVVATTRPELLCSCQVLMVNPQDARYKDLIGKHAIIPLYGREVSIIAHPYASMEFGSGIVMICSYGDYADVRLFREVGLPEIIAINKEGKMTHEAGAYAGLKIVEARKKIIEDLEKEGLVVKKEEIMHRTPTCERSKTPIEIIPMKEWYLKQLQDVPAIRKIAQTMKFHPDMHRQILLNWIDSITIDWPFSRRRVYGTEIPIWYCKACGQANIPKPGKYYQPWKDEPPFKKCSQCGDEKGFIGEDRTCDTWFDSGISPLFISKYGKDDKFFKKVYPTTLRPQAKDIVRTWLYYTLLRCYQLTKKAPFKHAWIMGYGVDEKGERMSKSKGNVIDPIPILEKYGADAFRFWNAAETSLGSDFRCSEARIVGGGKFLTKLWNVSRFISSFPQGKNAKLTTLDKWILSELNNLIKECLVGYEDFNFFIPSNRIRDFVWNIFAPHYIEMAKTRAYGQGFSKAEQQAAWFTLHNCLRTILLLSAPITPFVADYVWQNLYSRKSIHLEEFPKIKKAQKLPFSTEELLDLNGKIWKAKKDKGLSLKAEVKELTIPKKFKAIEKDLTKTHNIKSLKYGRKVVVK